MSLSFSAFVRSTNGSIQAVRETIGQDTVFTTFQNIGEEDAYGINAFGSIRKGKLTLNGGIDAFYAVLTNNIDDPLFNAQNEGFVFNTRLFGSYKLSERWVLQMFGFYRSSRVQLQGFTNPFYIYSLSINRNFKNDKGSIALEQITLQRQEAIWILKLRPHSLSKGLPGSYGYLISESILATV